MASFELEGMTASLEQRGRSEELKAREQADSVRPGFLQVPLGALAIAGAALGLTCLAALAVVASIKQVDTLSTVALALAVITFVAQLIVFVVQAGASNQQLVQARALHAELLALLSQISEQARGTRETVSRMDEKLLEAALGKTLPGRGIAPSDVRDIASEVASMVSGPSPSTLSGTQELTPRPVTDSGAKTRAEQRLSNYPRGERLTVAIEEVKKLSPSGRAALKLFGEDELNWSGTALGVGITLDSGGTGSQELLEHELIRITRPNGTLYALTAKGRDAAALLLAQGDPPPEHAEEIEHLRADSYEPDE